MNEFLCLVLPRIEHVIPSLRMSVAHMLVRFGCCRIPTLLLPSVIYIMGKVDPNSPLMVSNWESPIDDNELEVVVESDPSQ